MNLLKYEYMAPPKATVLLLEVHHAANLPQHLCGHAALPCGAICRTGSRAKLEIK